MKKILIMHAVPTNNGDAALVFALRNELLKQGYDVTISTTRYKLVSRLYPEVKWIKAENDWNRIERRIIRVISQKLMIRIKMLCKNKYKNIDVVISAPGGYVNSYYGFEHKFYMLKLIKKISGGKLIMYSQSVGPLNSRDKAVLKEYISLFDYFMARDDYSFEYVKQYQNCICSNDAAFLHDTLMKEKNNAGEKIVGISVREWKFDERNRDKYEQIITRIVYLLIDSGYRVEFISTCQGLQDYIDDSKVASIIYRKLEEKYQEYVVVNTEYYHLDALRKYITNFELVVGTRLHMCILSMLSGVPAFNISYEVKGKECYQYLKLEDYTVDYNEECDIVLEKLENFLAAKSILTKQVKELGISMHEEALCYFNDVLKKIEFE